MRAITTVEFNYQLDYQENPQTVDSYTADPDDVFYTNATLAFTLVRLNPHCTAHTAVSAFTVRHAPATAVSTPAVRHRRTVRDMRSRFPFGPMPPLPQPPGTSERALPGWTVPIRSRRSRPVMAPDLIQPLMDCTHAGEEWGHLQLSHPLVYAGPSGDDLGEHVNIIQHPNGRRKEVAVQRNNITNVYANAARYTTDTEPGSSGSPVFNNAWDLILIHHARWN